MNLLLLTRCFVDLIVAICGIMFLVQNKFPYQTEMLGTYCGFWSLGTLVGIWIQCHYLYKKPEEKIFLVATFVCPLIKLIWGIIVYAHIDFANTSNDYIKSIQYFYFVFFENLVINVVVLWFQLTSGSIFVFMPNGQLLLNP